MSNTVVVIAPHPDDETLGCGGTILKHKQKGDRVFWLIVTCISEDLGYSTEKVMARNDEIEQVAGAYGFDGVRLMNLTSTTLDEIPKSKMIKKFGVLFEEIQPDTVYAPYRTDAHSDHEVVFDATVACAKSFRSPFIKIIRIYETLSETEFGMRPEDSGFRPNFYVNISEFLDRKIEIMNMYEGEVQPHPFPRSIESIKALACLRGSFAGCFYSEAFMSLKETWR